MKVIICPTRQLVCLLHVSSKIYIRTIITKLNPLFPEAKNNSLAIGILTVFFRSQCQGTHGSLAQSHYLRLLSYLKNSIIRLNGHCDRLPFLWTVTCPILVWIPVRTVATVSICWKHDIYTSRTGVSTWFDRELQIDIGNERSHRNFVE